MQNSSVENSTETATTSTILCAVCGELISRDGIYANGTDRWSHQVGLRKYGVNPHRARPAAGQEVA